MKKSIFSLRLLLLLVLLAIAGRAGATYCHNDPVNNVDVLGMAEVALDSNRDLTAFGKAVVGIAKDDPEAARAILLAAQVTREVAGATVMGASGTGSAGSVSNVLRAIDTAVGVGRHDGREEWLHIAAEAGVSRDFDNGQATQSIWVDSLFAAYAPAIASNIANAVAFNAALCAASDRQTAMQNSPGYKLREIGLATADIPMHLGTAIFSGAMATDVTAGAVVTWNGWANGGGFGLTEVTPGQRAFAASLVFLPLGRGESMVDDIALAANATVRAESSLSGQLLRQDLLRQEAASAFDACGRLSQGALAGSREIIPAAHLGNPNIPAGFSKWSTRTFQSPSGDFQAHFYRNPTTGEVFHGLDYKIKFNLPP